MSAEMILKEESPSKIILETDPSNRKWAEYIRMLIIPPAILAGIIFFLRFPIWLNWVIAVVITLVEVLFILVVTSELTNTSVTIDFSSQSATRSEKLLFMNKRYIKLDLKQVERVLIHCEEVGHHCKMFLETADHNLFELDFYLPTEEKQEASFALAKTIGSRLQKPVVLKTTDQGIGSEKIIQP
jgi:hypothetical protein